VRRGARLRKGREIQRVFDEGASLRGSRFLLRWVRNEFGTVRWGFAVGKKLAPTAVERNALRRRLRAAVDMGVPGLDPGVDVVVVAGRGALGASVQEMHEEILRLVRRMHGGAAP